MKLRLLAFVCVLVAFAAGYLLLSRSKPELAEVEKPEADRSEVLAIPEISDENDDPGRPLERPMRPGGRISSGLGDLLERLREASPEDYPVLYEKALEVGRNDQRKGELAKRRVLDLWRAADPIALAEFGLSKEPGEQEPFLRAAINAMSLDDFDKITNIVDKIEDGELKERLLWNLTLRAARESPEIAVAKLEEIEAPEKRQEVEKAIALGWAAEDLEAGTSWIKEAFDEPRRSVLLSEVARSLVNSDSAAAAKILGKIEIPEERRRFRSGLSWAAQSFANTDFEAAAEWIGGLDEPNRSIALAAIAPEWAKRAPEEALEAGLAIKDRNQQLSYLQGALTQWGQDDLYAAVAWLNQAALPEANVGTALFSNSQEVGAMELSEVSALLASIGDPLKKRWAENGAANAISNQDPAKGAQFIESLGDPQSQIDAVSLIVIRWNSRDPSASKNWIDSLPDGALKQRGLVEYAFDLRDDNPALATEVVSELPMGEWRTDLLNRVVGRWMASDPDAATRHIKGLDFTGDELSGLGLE